MVCCAGPALSLLPLIVFRTRTPMSLAVCCLAAFMGLQAFCYAGFHAYVQVAHKSLEHCMDNDDFTNFQPNGSGACNAILPPFGSSDTAVRDETPACVQPIHAALAVLVCTEECFPESA